MRYKHLVEVLGLLEIPTMRSWKKLNVCRGATKPRVGPAGGPPIGWCAAPAAGEPPASPILAATSAKLLAPALQQSRPPVQSHERAARHERRPE